MEWKKGDKIKFNIKNSELVGEYFGRYDFLYCFNTTFKMLPGVAIVDKKSVAIINKDLLEKYGFTIEEVQAILEHEIGHIISTKQKNLTGLESEMDADEYAVSKKGADIVIRALEKTKIIQNCEASSKEKRDEAINKINQRIKRIKEKNIEKEYR